MSVGEGDPAPEFSARSHDGRTVTLADFRGRILVLFFYPRDNTPVCTREACGFRDSNDELRSLGAVVIGVSSSSADSHKGFIEKHALPYTLLADEGGALRNAFGAPRTLGFLPGRVTYVIDREGIVRMVLSAQFSALRHVQKALDKVKEISSSGETPEPEA